MDSFCSSTTSSALESNKSPRHCSNLYQIYVERCSLLKCKPNHYVLELLDALTLTSPSSPSKLHHLIMVDTYLGNNGVCVLLHVIKFATDLVVIDLSNQGINDSCCVLLLRSLMTHKKLQTLLLARNNIGNDSTVMICRLLRQIASLVQVEVSGNFIGKESCAKISALAYKNIEKSEIMSKKSQPRPESRIPKQGCKDYTTIVMPEWALLSFSNITEVLRTYSLTMKEIWMLFDNGDPEISLTTFYEGLRLMGVTLAQDPDNLKPEDHLQILARRIGSECAGGNSLLFADFLFHLRPQHATLRNIIEIKDEPCIISTHTQGLLDSIFDSKLTLSELFRDLDIDSTGTLSADELQQCISALTSCGPFQFFSEGIKHEAVEELLEVMQTSDVLMIPSTQIPYKSLLNAVVLEPNCEIFIPSS